jgi:hypothetical protein
MPHSPWINPWRGLLPNCKGRYDKQTQIYKVYNHGR